MRPFIAVVCLALAFLTMGQSAAVHAKAVSQDQSASHTALLHRLGLSSKLDPALFNKIVNQYHRIGHKKKPYLTIIDYTKPSIAKRFFVINMDSEVLLFNSHVAHGINSGLKHATAFSNRINSKQTSLGVFMTADTYHGSNGYSLRLDGLSPGKNDNARRRYIVIHGAKYAEKAYLDRHGRLGNSWGCPALPRTIAKAVIDTIKDGSVIYAHG